MNTMQKQACSFIIAFALLMEAGLAHCSTFFGRVLTDDTHAPVAGAQLWLHTNDFFQSTLATATSDIDGSFTLETTSDATPQILQVAHEGYIAYGPVDISSFSDPSSLEILLTPGGILRVQVLASDTGQPLADSQVSLEFTGTVLTDDQGLATFRQLVARDYRVCARQVQGEYLSTCLDGVVLPMDQTIAGPAAAVLAGQQTDVTIMSQRGGAITGRVTDRYVDSPLADSQVRFDVYTADGTFVGDRFLTTDAQGNYRVARLPEGAYFLSASKSSTSDLSFVPQLYPDVDCLAACIPADGQLISTTPGSEHPGVDFSLSPAALASGRVVDAMTGGGIAGQEVVSYVFSMGAAGAWLPHLRTRTDDQGYFELGYLPTTVDLRLGVNAAAGYVNSAWPLGACALDQCGVGQTFTVSLGETRGGFDFQLEKAFSARGQVTVLGAPAVANVRLYDASRTLIWQGESDEQGNYDSVALANGTYFAQAIREGSDPGCGVYADGVCTTAGEIDFDSAASFVATGGADVDGIDISLRTRMVFRDSFE